MGLFRRAHPSPSAGILGLEAPDPLLGDWRVTYGSRTVVRISGGPAGYAFTLMQRTRIAGSRHSAPAGAVVARVAWAGGRSYIGWHDLARADTGQNAGQAQFAVTLDRDARKLTGVIPEISARLTYRRA